MGLVKFLKYKLRRKTVKIEEPDGGDELAGILRYSWNEIERLTWNFSRAIGYGGFSTVYLAQSKDFSTAAVKIHGSSQRRHQAFKQELDILLRLGHHGNIVKLLGYCDDREEGVLIFEYISNGNLQEHLHVSKTCIPWKKRMSIAYQLAQAISHLHENCTPQIVHGDIKPSNILLDENLNCKLCDFGSAKLGFSSSVIPQSDGWRKGRMMLGSPGYTDPLYLRTGLASKKNDVYSFGVTVMELITGLEAVNPRNGERLASMAERLVSMIDPGLDLEFDWEEAKGMAELCGKCVSECASIRPCVNDILNTMRNRVPCLCS